MTNWLLVVWLLLQTSGTPAPEQNATPQSPGKTATSTVSDDTLNDLLKTLTDLRKQLTDDRRALEAETDPQKKVELQKVVDRHGKEVTDALARFEQVAAGVKRPQRSDGEDAKAFNLAGELESLLQPLIEQLKAATETPRRIEQLRKEIALGNQRRSAATKALESLDARIGRASGPLRDELAKLRKYWKTQRQKSTNSVQVAQFELDRKLSNSKSLLESTGNLADSFFRQRGLNLLFAVLAFLGVFFGLRISYQTFHRVRPFKRSQPRRLPGRLLDVLFHLFVIVAALGATLLVLYVANDWVLLVVVLIFLFGIGWASINMLPKLFEQVRLILNFGSVREGERIQWNGLPWRVASLGIQSVLENPELCGGWLRIPIGDLIGKHSRPWDDREGWFPTREGDWVILATGTRARIAVQTPERVQLELAGGGAMFVPTPAFLEANPRNLSLGFRVEIVFGIDYAHQANCTQAIPSIMDAKLREGLTALAGDNLTELQVEFKEASASSLDFEIQADFDGDAAGEFEPIQRAMARILVEACNEQGWIIPFQQLTLHQAAS